MRLTPGDNPLSTRRTKMNRRDFARSFAGATLGVAARETGAFADSPRPKADPPEPEGEAPGVPFKLSVMLWTVFQKLPFEQRLEKVAEAGYKYGELGISFDTTAGRAPGVGNPKERDAFLADLRKELPIMERIECPAIIVMSGDVVEGMSRAQPHTS